MGLVVQSAPPAVPADAVLKDLEYRARKLRWCVERLEQGGRSFADTLRDGIEAAIGAHPWEAKPELIDAFKAAGESSRIGQFVRTVWRAWTTARFDNPDKAAKAEVRRWLAALPSWMRKKQTGGTLGRKRRLDATLMAIDDNHAIGRRSDLLRLYVAMEAKERAIVRRIEELAEGALPAWMLERARGRPAKGEILPFVGMAGPGWVRLDEPMIAKDKVLDAKGLYMKKVKSVGFTVDTTEGLLDFVMNRAVASGNTGELAEVRRLQAELDEIRAMKAWVLDELRRTGMGS
jgi:hypothetical protein